MNSQLEQHRGFFSFITTMSKDYNIQRLFLICILQCIVLAGCIKEKFDPDKLDTTFEFTPGVATPLGYIQYNLEEMLADPSTPDHLIIQNDKFIILEYEEEIFSFTASEGISIPEVSTSASIQNNLGYPIDLGVISPAPPITDTTTISLDLQGPDYSEIDSIQVDTMELIFTINSSYNLTGNLEIYSPGIVKNGAVWRTKIALENEVVTIGLEDYTIILNNEPPNVNQLTFIYTLTLDPDQPGEDIIPDGETILDFGIRLGTVDYNAIFGYLGQMMIEVDAQSFPISFFNSIVEGTFHFDDPSLTLISKNTYGIPIQVIITDFAAVLKDDSRMAITGNGVPSASNPFNIDYPSLNQVGETIYDSVKLTSLNTNLFTVLEGNPREISFGVEGMTNPKGKIVNLKNFVTKDSYFSVQARLTLPFEGYAEFMLVMDTLRFDFEDFYDNPSEEIKRLAFRLNITNGFPVNVYLQGYFLDESMEIRLDSLFDDMNDEGRIVAAATDTDGDEKVDPYENEPIEIEFSREKIDNISGSKYLIFTGRINTTNFDAIPPDIVKFYADYFLDGEIGIIADLEVNTAEY